MTDKPVVNDDQFGNFIETAFAVRRNTAGGALPDWDASGEVYRDTLALISRIYEQAVDVHRVMTSGEFHIPSAVIEGINALYEGDEMTVKEFQQKYSDGK